MTTLPIIVAGTPCDVSNNSRLIFAAQTTEVRTLTLGNMPSNLFLMDTLNFNVEYRQSNRNDDTLSLNIRIVNGATILAAATAGGAFSTVNANVTSTTDIFSGAIAFAYVNTGQAKAVWDGASVEVQQIWTQNMGKDGCFVEVDYIEFTGTFTAETVVNVGTPNLTMGGASLSGTGEREIDSAGGALTIGAAGLLGDGITGRSFTRAEVTWAQLDLPQLPANVVSGSGALLLGSTVLAGSGVRTAKASGNLIVTAALSGAGVVGRKGTGDLGIPAAALQGTAERIIPGTGGALAVQPVSLAATGDFFAEVSGSGALALSPVALQGTGERTVDGSGALLLGSTALAGTGFRTVNGSGNLTIPQPVLSGAGDRIISGTGALDVGSAALQGTGEREITGIGSQVYADPGISIVESHTSTESSGGTTNIIFDNVLQEGDTVLVLRSGTSAGANSNDIFTEGYTRLFLYTNPAIVGDYKRMGPTPDTSVITRALGSLSYPGCSIVYVLRGVKDRDIRDAVEVHFDPGANGSTVDPAPITTIADDVLVMAIAAFGSGGNDTVTGFPSGYTNIETVSSGGLANGSAFAAATKLLTAAATEDPGIFTLDNTRNPAAVTLAIAPAGVLNGGLAIPAAFLAGSGSRIIPATGNLQIPAAVLASTGERNLTGSGNLQIPAAALQGTGVIGRWGWAAPNATADISVVESHTAQMAASTAATVNFSTTLEEGDVVVVVRNGQFSNPIINPAGYEQFADVSVNVRFICDFKRMGVTPDTFVDLEPLSLSNPSTGIVYVLRGVDQDVFLDQTLKSFKTGLTSNSANPPAITPVTDDTLVMAFGATTTPGASVTSFPAGYTNTEGVNNGAGVGTMGGAVKLLSGGTGVAEDPNPFSFSSFTNPTGAITIAVRSAKARSGGLNVPAVLLASAGERSITGVGALLSSVAALQGTGERTITGTGTLTPAPVSLASTGERTVTGIGALLSSVAALQGTGERTITASGALSIAPVELLGDGTVLGSVDGSGNLTIPLTFLTSTGEITKTGAGSLTVPLTALDGTGERTITGTGTLTPAPVSLASTGERTVTGIGALLSSVVALQGTGDRIVTGAGALDVGSSVLQGTGERIIPGWGAFVTNSDISVLGQTAIENIPIGGFTTLPLGPVVEGDVVVIARAGPGSNPISNPAGYEELAGASIMFKRMGPTPDTFVDVPTLFGAIIEGAGVAYIFRSIDGEILLDVPVESFSHGLTGVAANPPLITPVTADTLIMALGYFNQAGSVNSYPAGYTNTLDANVGGFTMGAAVKLLSSAGGVSEDPGEFVFNGITGGLSARTIAFRSAKSKNAGLNMPAVLLSGISERTITGVGSLTVPQTVLSGAGEVTVTGTGSLTIPAAVLQAIGERIVTGTGDLQIAAAVLDAIAERTVTGSGSLLATAAALEGTGAISGETTGSGSLTVPSAILASLGVRTSKGSGNLQIPAAALNSTAEREITGAAALQIASTLLAAVGEVTKTGAGSLTIPAAVLQAIGERTITGTGAFLTAPVTVSATGERLIDGAGALTLPAAELLGSGSVNSNLAGTGNLTIPSSILNGSGIVGRKATGGLTVPSTVLSATGTRNVTGTGALTLQAVTLSGISERTITGTAALTSPSAILAGTGNITTTASGGLTLPASVLQAIGERTITGAGAFTLTAAELNGTGGTLGNIGGSGALLVGQAFLAATGLRTVTGTGSLLTGAALLSSTGERTVTGTAAFEIASAALLGVGSGASVGSGGLTAPAAILAGSGVRSIVGTAALSLPATLLASIGEREITGSATFVTPSAALDGAGTIEAPVAGTGGFTVPSAFLDAVGERIVTGAGALLIPASDLSGSGTRIFEGTGALTIPSVLIEGVGVAKIAGTGAFVVPTTTLAAVGTRIVPSVGSLTIAPIEIATVAKRGIKGSGQFTLGPITLSASGDLGFVGEGNLVIGSVSMLGYDLVPIVGVVVIGNPGDAAQVIGLPGFASLIGNPTGAVEITGGGIMPTIEDIDEFSYGENVVIEHFAKAIDGQNLPTSHIIHLGVWSNEHGAQLLLVNTAPQVMLTDAGNSRWTIDLDFDDDISGVLSQHRKYHYEIWSEDPISGDTLHQAKGILMLKQARYRQ